jgi:hypothetical protein
LVDTSGKILAWYLPGILNHHLVRLVIFSLLFKLNILYQIKDNIADATKLLKKELANSVGGSNGSWRNDPDNFMVEGDKEPIFQPGSLDFAIGWFQARKEV